MAQNQRLFSVYISKDFFENFVQKGMHKSNKFLSHDRTTNLIDNLRP
jgi:hypothetical protein